MVIQVKVQNGSILYNKHMLSLKKGHTDYLLS